MQYRHNLRQLALELERMETGLDRLAVDTGFLPSPDDIKAFAWIRFHLARAGDKADALEPALWERIRKWQEKPYGKTKRVWRRVTQFFGWGAAIAIALASSALGWIAHF